MTEIERSAQGRAKNARLELLMSTQEVVFFEDGFIAGARWAMERCGCRECEACLKERELS